MRLPLVPIAFVLVAACVDSGTGPQPKRVDPGYVGKHLLTAPPALPTRIDATIGGKVVYLGNTLGQARLAPGQSVKVTHYWKVIAPPGDNYRVFMLVHGAPNTADFMSLPITDMQRAHGPATWRAGEIIEDEQDILLRPDWRSNEATILVGLIEVGAHGTLDRMPVTGPNAVDNAVVASKLDVDLSKAPPPPGTIHLPHAQGAITIDGVANDPGWIGAVQSPDFATAEGSPDAFGKATARMVWDEQYLYVFATVTDVDIVSEYKNQDDPLWKADVIEIFVDADSNKRGYVELQVNPNNATFDSWFATTRAQPGDEAWDSSMSTMVALRGTSAVGDTDTGWDVEIAIPWAAVRGRDDAMNVNTPPHVGDRWRMNMIRGDLRSDGKSKSASSWNRITYADWHALDRMLTVVFADTLGGVVPNSPPDPRPKAIDPAQGSAAGSAATGSAAPTAANVGSAAPNAGSANAGTGSANAGSANAGSANANAGSANAGSGSATPKLKAIRPTTPSPTMPLPPAPSPQPPAPSPKPGTTTPTAPPSSAPAVVPQRTPTKPAPAESQR